jgi:O-antigen/teichoic acid export membrane protein
LTETNVVFNVPRGTAYITYQQIVIYVTSFAYYIALFRILNLAQIGEVSLLAAALSVFTTVTQLSLPAAATRFISANIGSRYSSNAGGVARTTFRLLLSLAGPGLLFAVLASPIIGPTVFKTSDSTILLIATFAASFILDLTTLYGAYFLGLGLYAEMVYQNILYVPLSRGLGLVLAYNGFGPLGIPLGWALAASLTLLLSMYLWKGKLPKSIGFPARPLLVFSIPLFASALVTLIQSWGDITLLQAVLGEFGTTGAYYIVISSAAFLSILWVPAAGALYPALSSCFASDGPRAVSNKLGIAMRLVNLTVLPAGVALAAIAPTALESVYGGSLGNQATTFAILVATIIFSAQSLLLITTLQAVGRTTHILGISIVATIIDLVTVGFGASSLGTVAGAMGRALLAMSMSFLAWLSLRKILHAPVTKGLSKSLALAIFSAAPLIMIDSFLTRSLHVAPILRLSALLGVFAICFLTASRAMNVFVDEDFDLMENAFPRFAKPLLRLLERIFVQAPGL